LLERWSNGASMIAALVVSKQNSVSYLRTVGLKAFLRNELCRGANLLKAYIVI